MSKRLKKKPKSRRVALAFAITLPVQPDLQRAFDEAVAICEAIKWIFHASVEGGLAR
jgi:hypothetical protein